MDSSPTYSLLLDNIQGHEQHFLDTQYAPSFKQVTILKGSLVESLIPSDISAVKQVYKLQASHAVYSSSSQEQSGVLLFASPKQLYMLTVKQRDLLSAIDSCQDRIEVLNKLRWIESLAKGSEVYVTLATIPVPVCGVVRYVGELSGLDGTRFGVELMERRGKGDSNGSFQGQTYFKCDKKCAVFVSMDMLTDYCAAGAAKPSDEAVPSGSLPLVKVFDNVTFSDVRGHRHIGLVRWIGTDTSVQSGGIVIVGIEAEKSLDITTISHHITMPSGSDDYFSLVQQGSRVFLPIQCVANETNRRNDQGNSLMGWEWIDNSIEFHDALTHQTPETATTHGNHLLENSSTKHKKNGSSNSLNPYNLKEGSVIKYNGKIGEIKQINQLPECSDLLAEVEMDEDLKEENDDNCDGVQTFTYINKSGIFVDLSELQPYTRARPLQAVTKEPKKASIQHVHQKHKDKKHDQHRGIWNWFMCFRSTPTLGNDDDLEDKSKSGKSFAKRDVDMNKMEYAVDKDTSKQPRLAAYKFEVGSAVQYGNPVQYGTIRQLVKSPVYGEECAIIEWEVGGNGEIQLSGLQPDGRFIVDVNDTTGQLNPLEKKLYYHDEKKLPVVPPVFDKHKHSGTKAKGIQGCHNSCYLDATLYGLFAFSDAFDVVFLDMVTHGTNEYNLQQLLKNKIVYALRKVGVVVQDSVQELRTHLADLQKMKGYTSDEKDPEEFLNLLFKHILHLDPFVHIRRPSGVDKEFLIQLFVEPVEGVSVVHTQQLLTRMFQQQDISFVKYPSRLLLQMPRYGKKFKSFQCIIPSLELDIKELCGTKSRQCFMCNKPSNCVCDHCNNEPSLQESKKLYFCNNCSQLWHNHSSRQSHRPQQLKPTGTDDDFDTGKLQLLSVLCIETSHYVCFTRVTENEWVFFDSMAERLDSGYNLPKVTVCTQLLQEYVYGGKDISGVPTKTLPELVRRFIEDAYMCIYIDHEGVMYQ